MELDSILGDLGREDEMRQNRVKGNLVLSRAWYLAEFVDASTRDRVLKLLPRATQELLRRTLMPFAWVSFSELIDIDQAIIREVMGGRVEEMRPFGHRLGLRDFNSVYRAFLSLPSTEFVLGKVSAIGSMYFRESTLGFEGDDRGHGGARIALVGRSMPLYMCNHGISGWLGAVLEVTKAKGIHVEHEKCVHRGDPRCEWACRWDVGGAAKRRP